MANSTKTISREHVAWVRDVHRSLYVQYVPKQLIAAESRLDNVCTHLGQLSVNCGRGQSAGDVRWSCMSRRASHSRARAMHEFPI